jgi:hypothetical protein
MFIRLCLGFRTFLDEKRVFRTDRHKYRKSGDETMGLADLFFKERRTTVSLLNQSYLIADASHSARQEQERIDAILKEFHEGNYARIEEFSEVYVRRFSSVFEAPLYLFFFHEF